MEEPLDDDKKSSFDTINQHEVAIKKLSPFNHYLCSLRALREIKFLSSFQHDNIIPVLGIIKNRISSSSFDDIYLVFEKMDTDLSQVLKNQRLKPGHVCYFTYQLLRGLKYLHSANIVHRDLKPSNLLVNSNCDLKICDFGLARVTIPKNIFSAIMTEYVATRWYRAPEIMLNSRCYGLAIDIWSVGCILGEMLLGCALFQGQHCSVHHFVDRCLTFNPQKRYDVYQCISHPYVSEYHDDEDEPVYYKRFQINEDVDEDLPRDILI
ncbi:hypothetical protein MXB_3192, partial [Myxobolus squamalis]